MNSKIIKTTSGIPIGAAVMLDGEPALEIKRQGGGRSTITLKELIAKVEKKLKMR